LGALPKENHIGAGGVNGTSAENPNLRRRLLVETTLL